MYSKPLSACNRRGTSRPDLVELGERQQALVRLSRGGEERAVPTKRNRRAPASRSRGGAPAKHFQLGYAGFLKDIRRMYSKPLSACNRRGTSRPDLVELGERQRALVRLSRGGEAQAVPA